MPRLLLLLFELLIQICNGNQHHEGHDAKEYAAEKKDGPNEMLVRHAFQPDQPVGSETKSNDRDQEQELDYDYEITKGVNLPTSMSASSSTYLSMLEAWIAR